MSGIQVHPQEQKAAGVNFKIKKGISSTRPDLKMLNPPAYLTFAAVWSMFTLVILVTLTAVDSGFLLSL